MTCSHQDCNFKTYINSDKCIFHCDKDNSDWQDNGKWIEKSVSDFWSKLREYKLSLKNEYNYFIFPKFEFYPDTEEKDKFLFRDEFNIINKNFGIIQNTRIKTSSGGSYPVFFSILNNAKFIHCKFLDTADFSKIRINGSINFSNSIFYKDLQINNKGLDSINFENCIFYESLDLSDKNISVIYLKHIQCKKNLIFKNSTIKSHIDLSNSNIKGILDFTLSILGDKNHKKNLVFNMLTINESFINAIYFNITTFYTSLDISNSTIKKLIFKNSYFDENNVNIYKTTINILKLNNYINKSNEFVVNFLKINKKLAIQNISFLNERFNHLDISKCKVVINDSSFNEDFFHSVKWGDINDKRFFATRDIFRQLKYFSENQKNFIDADSFYTLEMKERKKELNEDNKKTISIKDKIAHFINHTAVFYLHEKTSNFSQNWLLPIFWIFILGMVGVIIQNFAKSNIDNHLLCLSLFLPILFVLFLYKKINNHINIYFFIFIIVFIPYLVYHNSFLNDIAILINPIKLLNINHNSFEGHEFIGLIFRILTVFLIYQTIVALKKKVRNK